MGQNTSVHEQIKNIDSCLTIHFDFSDYHGLQEKLEKITNAQQQLTELQKQLNQIIETIEHGKGIIDILFGITSFFGNSGFALDWLDEEHGLIISSAGEFKSVADIFNECESLKEKSGKLILQVNTLRGQVEQSLKQLEQEQRRNKFSNSYSAKNISQNQNLQTLTIKEQQPNKSTKLKPLILVIASSLAVFGFGSCIGREKFSPVQQMSLISNQEVDAVANFKSAKKIAMEASLMVQKPPHPLEVWQQAETKWQEALKLLESIPEGTPVSAEAKNKLAAYRLNHKAINQRLITEKEAAANWENAQKLAMEAAVMVQNPPHPQEVWQNAKVKWEQSINLLESIPKGTFVYQQTKEKLATYRTNYVAISARIK
ncbi:MAG: hypothetical protein QNJ47_08655 [Nostocaceae cyanobacterium]|nr:hypothetical protein [Nostocaceae cyanobacterium]